VEGISRAKTLDRNIQNHAYYVCLLYKLLQHVTNIVETSNIPLSIDVGTRRTLSAPAGTWTDMQRSGNMQQVSEHGSEVARLLAQISAEYEAARRGMDGFAYGASKHAFITARMEHMGQLHTQLQSLVGETAIALIADTLNNAY
jgi:hypothetical protein